MLVDAGRFWTCEDQNWEMGQELRECGGVLDCWAGLVLPGVASLFG
jgi:hypothetical protein